jgi:hypothetical protein
MIGSNGSHRQVTERISKENKFWLSYGHLTVQFGHLSFVLKLATWKLYTSSRVKFTKELVGYEPKVRVENCVVPLSWWYWPMLAPLIHSLSPLTAGEERRQRVQIPPRVPGTMGWFGWAGNGGGCHCLRWHAMVCRVPDPLDITCAIACDKIFIALQLR